MKPLTILQAVHYNFNTKKLRLIMRQFKNWIFLFAVLFVSHSLNALTTLEVTKSTDNDPGGFGEAGDLRYTLNTMNQNLNTMLDDYAIVFEFPMTIQLNGILPIINNSANPVNITIGNSGSIPTVTIDGNSTYSGFFIPIGNVTIQNMIFQNLIAKGGDGGSGIAAGGGGMGAGGAIYAPQTFLYGSNPSITLINVLINNNSAVGGNGGSYFSLSATGNEGGGGGGGFSGNGGSVTIAGITGGAGGGGFGGNGGDVVSTSGGGSGGGGFGSRATLGTLTNLGDGGSDQSAGLDGNGYGLTNIAGAGAGGNSGGNSAGGGGGGGTGTSSGGGGGGSAGTAGLVPEGNTPPFTKNGLPVRGKNQITPMITTPSGGSGGDGGGAGGGGVVITGVTSNNIDGQAGSAGYGGGGGGGAGTGAYDASYTVQGGSGGLGGGGGGGGVNQSGTTPAEGGNSLGGGGGGGGGPSNGANAAGGSDAGNLGGGGGGFGANTVGTGSGGGGGGGGSGLGGAIFVDSNLNFSIQAMAGIPTSFNTSNNTVQAGTHGAGGPGASDGLDGSALGDSIFLRAGSALTLMANDTTDLLTLGAGVSFKDDTSFGAGGTAVFVKGNGTIIYNGTSDYQGSITVNNANFKVNGEITNANISVCRNISLGSQRGTLSGTGTMTGNVFVNSGTISPGAGGIIRLGSLTLQSATSNTLGSLVHIDINSGGSSLVTVTGSTSLAGTLEINLDSSAPSSGTYTLLTSAGGITGTFDTITFTGHTPNYSLSYLPLGAPTYVQLNYSSVDIPATVNGAPIVNPAVVCCGRPIILGPLPVPGSGLTTYTVTHQTGNVSCQIGQTESQTYLRVQGPSGSCTIVGTKDGVTSNPLTVSVP